MGLPATTTTFDLPDVSNDTGTFSISVTVPETSQYTTTQQTIQNISEVTKKSDDSPAIQELGTCTLSIVDTPLNEGPSDYNQGWWWKLIEEAGEENITVKILLTQAGTETLFFYGALNPLFVSWEEHYIGERKIRTAEIILDDVAKVALETTCQDWVDEIYSNKVSNASTLWDTDTAGGDQYAPSSLVNLKVIFASLLSASGLNASYDADDVTFVFDTENPDFMYYNDAQDTYYRVDEIWFPTDHWDRASNVAGETEVENDYFKSDEAVYLPTLYALSIDMVGAILRNFGLVAEFTYDIDDSRFKINLFQRGRAYATTVTLDTPTSSTIIKTTDLTVDAVKFRFHSGHSLDPEISWMSKRYTGFTTNNDEPPNYVEFDIDETVLWYGSGGNQTPCIYGGTTDSVTVEDRTDTRIAFVKWWDYQDGDYVMWGTSLGGDSVNEERIIDALAGYFYKRFSSEYRMITRRYPYMRASDGSTNLHTNIGPLTRTNIDLDGTGDVTYLANSVTKHPFENEVTVEWIEE